MLPGLKERECQELLLSVGKATRDRRPLSPVEVGEMCAKAIEAGATTAQVTAALKMTDRSMIRKFLSLRTLVDEVRHLVSWGYSGEGAIGFTVGAQLARMPAASQPIVAEAIIKHQLTRDEMVSVLQLLERSGQSVQECVLRVVRRRPVVRLKHMFLGAITSSDLRSRLSDLSQGARDEILSRVVSRVFPGIEETTAKLGRDRFAIIGGSELAKVGADGTLVEQQVNGLLEAMLS